MVCMVPKDEELNRKFTLLLSRDLESRNWERERGVNLQFL